MCLSEVIALGRGAPERYVLLWLSFAFFEMLIIGIAWQGFRDVARERKPSMVTRQKKLSGHSSGLPEVKAAQKMMWEERLQRLYFIWDLCLLIPLVVAVLIGLPVWDFFRNLGWYGLTFPTAFLTPWIVHYALRWIYRHTSRRTHAGTNA
jgi:hypothetical protein